MRAWLLLLLDTGDSYGWALFGELRDRGISIEASLAYRDLRELERDGLVTSRWMPSAAGPQRRFYRLTSGGRQALRDLAATVRAASELHEMFARALDDVERGAPGVPAPSAHDEAAAARPGPELRAAWLMLLLGSGVSYGYELRQELDARNIRIDPATMYRLLRKLERTGWLESRWMNPSAGPRRRLYRLTTAGRRNLDELAILIRASRDAHRAFLDAYEVAASRSAG